MFQTTPERRANLVKLARFLWDLPLKQFNMGLFTSDDYEDIACVRHTCTSVGCAVGWGPSAGIIAFKSDHDWYGYSDRVFGDDGLYDWCFHSDWKDTDNTPQGASKRILYALIHGIPDDYIEPGSDEFDDDRMSPAAYANWQPTEADWQRAERGDA